MDPISIAWGLSQYAPSIIRWLSGSDKAADVAQDVVDLAKKVTGKGTGEEALEAIKADPNKVLEFQQALANISADLDKAYLADRQDARKREVALQQAGRTSWEMMVLSAVAIVGLVAIGIILFFAEPPDGAKEMLLLIIGALVSRVGDVYSYYFGSSRSSAEKNTIIERLRG